MITRNITFKGSRGRGEGKHTTTTQETRFEENLPLVRRGCLTRNAIGARSAGGFIGQEQRFLRPGIVGDGSNNRNMDAHPIM
jgi:hypothetical protein